MPSIDQLKGLGDVEFDFGVSAATKTQFTNSANALEGAKGQLPAFRDRGYEDFEGYYARLFIDNGNTQMDNVGPIIDELRRVVTLIEGVEEAARAENARRAAARAWADHQAHKSTVDKIGDGIKHAFGGGDDVPPPVDMGSGPSVPAASPPATPRQPMVGIGQSGGTSSGSPANLRSFASSTRGVTEGLQPQTTALTSAQESFHLACSWATLDASGLIASFGAWLQANMDEATWADTVAAAFAAAGSNGSVPVPNSAIAASLAAHHVSASRATVAVEPATAYGSPPTTGYADDPVNTATGNFLEVEEDLTFSAPAALLSLVRTYNSMNPAAGAFGPGWSSWTEAGLSFADDAARLTMPDGRVIRFSRLGDGWDRSETDNLWLVRTEAGHEVRGLTGEVWRTSASGRLTELAAGDGTRVSLSHDEHGRLVRLQHEFGRWLELQYAEVAGADRVVAVVASDHRRVDYRYDEAGRLVAARIGTAERSYRWNDAGLVQAVVDPDGVVEVDNAYDELGRVVQQRSPHGRTTFYGYLPGNVTVVSDEDGTRSNTWIHDQQGRLVGIIDGEDQRQSMSYDRHGNVVMVTERNGATTVAQYDEQGHQVARVLPTGARLEWRHDELGRAVEATVVNDDQRAVTRLEYQGEGTNPVSLTDPEGGVTRMVWERGLLKQVTDPTGVVLTLTHDEFGELVATTDAAGNTARLERDVQGRVVAAVTPLGNRTTYVYDEETGALASQTDPTGATWRYEYTAAGRTTAIIDPLGNRTEVAYDEAGEQAATTDPLGRTITEAYDDLGNLAAVELPDGSRWGFGYDTLSRQTSWTDFNGGEWSFDFDANGFLTRTVDPTKVEREFQTDAQGRPTEYALGDDVVTGRYDRLGRMIATTEADGSTVVSRYDLCGRLAEVVDAEGGVTSFTRDAAGRVVSVTQPLGLTYHYEYDECGRWLATISTGGNRYEMVYDADGQIVGEIWPTGDRVSTVYDAAGRIVERREPGKGTARVTYDKAGQITSMRDAFNGLRKFHYDAAGQLVEVVNSLGGRTRFEYDGMGRQCATVDPMGGRASREFDAMGRVVSETDQLGRTTRFTYDLAGRPTRRVDATGTCVSWEYDAAGRLARTLANGELLSSVERDFVGRSVRTREVTARGEVVHELAWDRNGGLAHRLRDGEGIRYEYDANGHVTLMRRPDGVTTTYEYDDNNQVCALTHPGVGRVVVERDGLGRMVSMAGDGLHATWAWADGVVVEHRVNRRGFLQFTAVERDDDGRVTAQVVDGLRTEFSYDEGGQLVSSRTSEGTVSEFGWDANGRLVSESVDGAVTRFAYDAASQVQRRVSPDGVVTEFTYDGAGRRTRESGGGLERVFSWDPRGFLADVTSVAREGDRVRVVERHDAWVDALGELAAVDEVPVWWDATAGLPSLAQVGASAVLDALSVTVLPGVDGADARWLVPGVDDQASVWGSGEAAGLPGLPSGLGVLASGGLALGGLEWMQARVFDPSSRGFVSTDPLLPVTGAAWAGNPYSFAGNDPVNLSDPWGLSPVTDAQLQGYRNEHRGFLGRLADRAESVASQAVHVAQQAGHWVAQHKEKIIAGALIVGGVVVMATGVGGPVGAMMISGALTSGGMSMWEQSSHGPVDYRKVLVSAAIGAATAPLGGMAGKAAGVAVKGFGSCLGRNMITTAVESGTDNAVGSTAGYLQSGEPLTVRGVVSHAASGFATGAAMGAPVAAFAKVTGVARFGCFAEGTGVLMADGSSKAIQDVQVGDEVLGFDAATGEATAARVSRTFVHELVETLRVTTAGGGTVTTTGNHPFYVEGRGYVPAGELHAGDVLRGPDGSPVVVESVQGTGRSETVFNLEVEGVHNYHVAADDGTWVLVHNNMQCAHATPAPKGGVYVLKDFNGDVVRTGRTKDLVARQRAHNNDPVLRGFRFEAIHRTDSYAEQRGLEHLLYEAHPSAMQVNGGHNKIRAISPTNPKKGTYIDAALSHLSAWGEKIIDQ